MKVASGTGVLGGIGRESAIQLGRAGYAIVGMDVVDTTDLSAFEIRLKKIDYLDTGEQYLL